MLVAAKPAADFSAGCVSTSIGHLLFATHPFPYIKTGALAMGLRPEEGHAPPYRGRSFSLG
jgi:hypothetical protein